jgi:hypothetical protein
LVEFQIEIKGLKNIIINYFSVFIIV